MGASSESCQPCTATQSEEPNNVDQSNEKAADQLSPSDEQTVKIFQKKP